MKKDLLIIDSSAEKADIKRDDRKKKKDDMPNSKYPFEATIKKGVNLLRVRKDPSITAPITCFIPENTEVTVLNDCNEKWYYIKTVNEDQTVMGFVKAEFVAVK